MTCVSGVVYKIPLSCGKVYIGQTGRCLNDRLREHNYSLRATVGGHLAVHCKNCLCKPSFEETTLVDRHKAEVTREVIEACCIAECGTQCISEPSVALSWKETLFLTSTMKGVGGARGT